VNCQLSFCPSLTHDRRVQLRERGSNSDTVRFGSQVMKGLLFWSKLICNPPSDWVRTTVRIIGKIPIDRKVFFPDDRLEFRTISRSSGDSF